MFNLFIQLKTRTLTDLEELLINDVCLLERMQLVDGVRMIVAVLGINLESFPLHSISYRTLRQDRRNTVVLGCFANSQRQYVVLTGCMQ